MFTCLCPALDSIPSRFFTTGQDVMIRTFFSVFLLRTFSHSCGRCGSVSASAFWTWICPWLGWGCCPALMPQSWRLPGPSLRLSLGYLAFRSTLLGSWMLFGTLWSCRPVPHSPMCLAVFLAPSTCLAMLLAPPQNLLWPLLPPWTSLHPLLLPGSRQDCGPFGFLGMVPGWPRLNGVLSGLCLDFHYQYSRARSSSVCFCS